MRLVMLKTQENQWPVSTPGTCSRSDFPDFFRLWRVPKLAEDCGLATRESKKTDFLFRPTHNSHTPPNDETPPVREANREVGGLGASSAPARASGDGCLGAGRLLCHIGLLILTSQH